MRGTGSFANGLVPSYSICKILLPDGKLEKTWPRVPRLGRTATAQDSVSRGLPYPDGQAALRRSPTMAGNSGTGSLLHNFHQGRGGGGNGGWKL